MVIDLSRNSIKRFTEFNLNERKQRQKYHQMLSQNTSIKKLTHLLREIYYVINKSKILYSSICCSIYSCNSFYELFHKTAVEPNLFLKIRLIYNRR